MLVLAGNGYCYNSHEHNIRSRPRVCDAAPEPTPNVLSYTFMSFAKAVAMALGHEADANISVCGSDMLHGTYDFGTRPAAAFITFSGLVGDTKYVNGI